MLPRSKWFKAHHQQLLDFGKDGPGREPIRGILLPTLCYLVVQRFLSQLVNGEESILQQTMLGGLFLFGATLVGCMVIGTAYYRKLQSDFADAFRYAAVYCLVLSASPVKYLILFAYDEKILLPFLIVASIAACAFSACAYALRRSIQRGAFASSEPQAPKKRGMPPGFNGVIGAFCGSMLYTLIKDSLSRETKGIILLASTALLIVGGMVLSYLFHLKYRALRLLDEEELGSCQ